MGEGKKISSDTQIPGYPFGCFERARLNVSCESKATSRIIFVSKIYLFEFNNRQSQIILRKKNGGKNCRAFKIRKVIDLNYTNKHSFQTRVTFKEDK